jgi:hypothetical protein
MFNAFWHTHITSDFKAGIKVWPNKWVSIAWSLILQCYHWSIVMYFPLYTQLIKDNARRYCVLGNLSIRAHSISFHWLWVWLPNVQFVNCVFWSLSCIRYFMFNLVLRVSRYDSVLRYLYYIVFRAWFRVCCNNLAVFLC